MRVHPVEAVPEVIEGGGVQSQVRDLEGQPAGQRVVPQLTDDQAGPVEIPLVCGWGALQLSNGSAV